MTTVLLKLAASGSVPSPLEVAYRVRVQPVRVFADTSVRHATVAERDTPLHCGKLLEASAVTQSAGEYGSVLTCHLEDAWSSVRLVQLLYGIVW